MLKAEDGATFETDLKETEAGWLASYRVVSANLDQVEPGLRVFPSEGWPCLG